MMICIVSYHLKAYPNKENVEGLNIAFEMMDNIGKRKYAVAMSKVVPSDEGRNKSDKLFEQLDISQDSIISIYYNQQVALSNRYPITDDDVSGTYSELSDYILDSERIVFNRKYLANGRKQSILQNMFLDSRTKVDMEVADKFITRNALSIMIYNNKEQLYALRDQVIDSFDIQRDVFVPNSRYLFLVDSEKIGFSDILLDDDISITDKGLKILNRVVAESSVSSVLSNTKIDSVSKLLELLTNIKSSEDVFAFGTDIDKNKKYESFSSIRVFIDLKEDFFNGSINELSEALKGLTGEYNRAVCDLQFKFVISSELWGKYQEIFNWLKTSVIEARVSKKDIRNLIYRNVNIEYFKSYIELEKSERTLRENGADILWNETKRSAISVNDIVAVYKLIVGLRKCTDEYSESVEDYIYNYFVKNKGVELSKLVDLLQKATELEQSDLIKQDEPLDDDRAISFKNLKQVLK